MTRWRSWPPHRGSWCPGGRCGTRGCANASAGRCGSAGRCRQACAGASRPCDCRAGTGPRAGRLIPR
eukprot:1941493-Lingulodinium_polyedra.AAC.1